jgi:hypothetical protein
MKIQKKKKNREKRHIQPKQLNNFQVQENKGNWHFSNARSIQNDGTSEIDFELVVLSAPAHLNAKGLTWPRHVREIHKHVPDKSKVHIFKCKSSHDTDQIIFHFYHQSLLIM